MNKKLWEGRRPCSICNGEFIKPIGIEIWKLNSTLKIEITYLCKNKHCFNAVSITEKGQIKCYEEIVNPHDSDKREFNVIYKNL